MSFRFCRDWIDSPREGSHNRSFTQAYNPMWTRQGVSNPLSSLAFFLCPGLRKWFRNPIGFHRISQLWDIEAGRMTSRVSLRATILSTDTIRLLRPKRKITACRVMSVSRIFPRVRANPTANPRITNSIRIAGEWDSDLGLKLISRNFCISRASEQNGIAESFAIVYQSRCIYIKMRREKNENAFKVPNPIGTSPGFWKRNRVRFCFRKEIRQWFKCDFESPWIPNPSEMGLEFQ